MIFISTLITLIFVFFKMIGWIEWHWVFVITPLFLDALTITVAKLFGGAKYIEIMLCNPFKIKSVMRSKMLRRTS